MSVALSGRKPLKLSHIAGRNRCHPGEAVVCVAQVRVEQPVDSYMVIVALPEGLRVNQTQPLARVEHQGDTQSNEPWRRVLVGRPGQESPMVLDPQQGTLVQWEQPGPLSPGSCYEYQLVAQIESFDQLWRYHQAKLQADQQARQGDQEDAANDELALERESPELTLFCYAVVKIASHDVDTAVAPITVERQSAYLRYLPALYEQDGDFIGRFLMLFESFWAPVEQQIEHVYDYFDLNLTPVTVLHWLATWFDLELPVQWAEERQRHLLAEIVQLYRQRGTRRGLQRYLELVTGGKVQITEYTAYQFRIGSKTRLGTGVAFGRHGRPHTFAVQLTLPSPAQEATAETEAAASRLREQTQAIVERIIEAEKPAHTAYTVSIEYTPRG